MFDWLPRIGVLALKLPIHAYRLVLSPLLGPRCRFQPTCSGYALEALDKHGPLKGTWLAMRRLSRCHPVRWLGGRDGYDPVPEVHRPHSPACQTKTAESRS